MSHFTHVKTKYTNKASLLKALQRLHLEPVTHTQKVSIRGYKGRPGPGAEICVPYEQFNGRYKEDLGFALQKDGSYEAIYSNYDLRNGGLGKDFLQRLSEEYAIAQIESDGTYEVVEKLEQGKYIVRKKALALAYEGVGMTAESAANSWSSYEV